MDGVEVKEREDFRNKEKKRKTKYMCTGKMNEKPFFSSLSLPRTHSLSLSAPIHLESPSHFLSVTLILLHWLHLRHVSLSTLMIKSVLVTDDNDDNDDHSVSCV